MRKLLTVRAAICAISVVASLSACGDSVDGHDGSDATTLTAGQVRATYLPTGPTIIEGSCATSARGSFAADGLPGMVGDDLVQIAVAGGLSAPMNYRGQLIRGQKVVIYVRHEVEAIDFAGSQIGSDGTVQFAAGWPPIDPPSGKLNVRRAGDGKWWSSPAMLIVPTPGCYQIVGAHGSGTSVVQFVITD